MERNQELGRKKQEKVGNKNIGKVREMERGRAWKA